MYRIKLTKNGTSGNGIYIGRPSYYGNIFPIKKSKFSSVIYTIQESLSRYENFLKLKRINPIYLYNNILLYNEIILDCWCVNKIFDKDYDFENNIPICHGEIIAKYVFELLKKGKENEKRCRV